MQELELCREVLKNFSLKHVHCSAENGTIEFGSHTISPTEMEVPRIGGIRTVPGWEVSVITHSYDVEGMLYDVDVNPVEKCRTFPEALLIVMQGEAKKECERLMEVSGITYSVEYEAFSSMSASDLVAYWNILQTPAIRGGDTDKMSRHEGIVQEILTGRGINPEKGKRLTRS